ncbi:Ionotropic receptor 164 [Frankliniella occidentalis]|nr:Ionotropic receptor 164 [Frankliniella occidentalis]
MDAALVLVLVCTAAPGALCALPDVDMTAPPEATSALALLSPFLAAQKTTLLILGQVNWTRDFLRGLSPETSWVLFPDERAQNDRFQGNFGVEVNCTALVVSDNPADPYSWMERKAKLTNYCRVLFWITTDKQVAIPYSFHICNKLIGVAVTAPKGSTTLFTVAPKYCGSVRPTLVEVDRWSHENQSWPRADAIFRIFYPFCSRWRPPAADESLTVYEMLREDGKPLPEFFKTLSTKIRGTRRTGNIMSNLAFPGNNLANIIVESWQKIEKCQLPLMLLEYGEVVNFDPRKVSVMAEKAMFEISAFVPAGLGPAVNPLDAVLVEFSTAVWLGTALAALSTAAALACILRRDRGAALLLALAPLHGQASGTPPPASCALRPLLGVWLLVCVVLVAAYQGLLLGKLSTARDHAEVNSLRALKETGLPVYVMWSALTMLEKELIFDSHKPHTIPLGMNASETLQHIAQHRNCAMIAIHDRTLRRLLHPLTIPQKKVHSFPLVPEKIRLIAVWTHGSPLGELSRSTYEHLDQAGILDHWEDKLDEGNKVALARYLVSLQQVMALTLRHVAPAFYVLFIGLALATLALGVELVTARWCGARGSTATPAGQRPGGSRQGVRRCRPAAALRPRARGAGRLAPDIPLEQLHCHPVNRAVD